MQVCNDIRLSPLLRPQGRIPRVITRYGLHDAAGRRMRGWPLLASLDTTLAMARRRPVDGPWQHLEGAYIFGGVYYAPFGHFIAETVANLAAVARVRAEHPGRKVLFFLPPNWMDAPPPPKQAAFHAPFLRTFGLSFDDAVFVTAPTQVDRLIIGDSPMVSKHRHAPWLLDALDTAFPPIPPGRRVYLSRSRWTHSERVVDEPRIEAQFTDAGFEIIHPQELSLEDQITLAREAEFMAGPQGTALHWSLYAGGCRGVLSRGWPSPVQKGICAARGQRYLNPKGHKPDRKTPRLRAFTEAQIEANIARLLT